MYIGLETGLPETGQPNEAKREQIAQPLAPQQEQPSRPVEPVDRKWWWRRPTKTERLRSIARLAEQRKGQIDFDMPLEESLLYQFGMVLLEGQPSLSDRVTDFLRRKLLVFLVKRRSRKRQPGD